MTESDRPFYVAGRPETSRDPLIVRHPYDGSEVGRTSQASPWPTHHRLEVGGVIVGDVPSYLKIRRDHELTVAKSRRS